MPEAETFLKNLQDDDAYEGDSLKETQKRDNREKEMGQFSRDTSDSVAIDKITETQQCPKEDLTYSSPVTVKEVTLEEGHASGGQNVAPLNGNSSESYPVVAN